MTSSCDLLADRRFAWAKALADGGDHAAAADLLDQVVERVPGWAPGWAALGEARERTGDAGSARTAWARVAALDPDETFGADLHLARLDGRTPDAMAGAYVAALFDDYAPRFDRHLLDALDYRGPAVILAALDRAAPGRRFARALDLGCGTGLMGLAIGGRADRIDGVDLSPAMVERARATGAYSELRVGSLEAALAAADPGSLDLALAADVLVYVGDLRATLDGAARALASGAVLAFTVQGFTDTTQGPRRFALGPDLRFAHAPDYIEAELERAGFERVRLDAISTRTERGTPVPGLVAVGHKR